MSLSSPFFHQALSTSKVMLIVCIALLPGIIVQSYFFSYGVLINVFFCSLFAIIAEYFVLYLRKRKPWKIIKDNSALVTGILMGIAIPPTLPLWMSFIGVCFAIIVAKQLYGGLGFNPFNPAMVGYVLLLISFPVEMTSWLPATTITPNVPDFSDSLNLILFSQTSNGDDVEFFRQLADGYTMATPLDFTKTQFTLGLMTSEILTNETLLKSHHAWHLVNLAFLVGGLILLFLKIIRWHIPVAFLSGIILTSYLLYYYDPNLFMPTSFHLTTGATMLGAFFIATDPISASTTPKGRLIYGFLIGFLIVLIRAFGGYPEAVGFAVLLLNLASPTIDHYTKPTIYGHNLEEHANE